MATDRGQQDWDNHNILYPVEEHKNRATIAVGDSLGYSEKYQLLYDPRT